ncbi:MAG: HupE/UreJ family protein [Planctomycetales bacterium]|nr:HupE/UreJ family protein [bacterium]UNM08710.1 MAG: HupE/UreJ family protein [Planctomycetales bacterium]
MKQAWLAILLLAALATQARPALAHESKPCVLNITQLDETQFRVSWKTPPPTGPEGYPVSLELPADWLESTPVQRRSLSDGELEIRSVAIEPGRLDGSVVSFPGLEGMVTEVFVRVSRLDGSNYSALVRSTDPRFELSGERGWQQRSIEFIVMGFEHILKGADHLLFVFGLLLIVGGARQLIKTVTAFTLAHSITLALAALGVVNLPPAPIEALIALSILLLGPEVIHRMKGETSLAIRMPWLVAFVFGLLHGFGFAGGLSLIGMPRVEIPLSLLSFNVGVELGQLAFVGMLLLLYWPLRRLSMRAPLWLRESPAYVIGISGAFWFIQRSFPLVFG